MRGKPRRNNDAVSGTPEPTASESPAVIAINSGAPDDTGKPGPGSTRSAAGEDTGGIAPPEPNFGIIEAEEPIITRIDSPAFGAFPDDGGDTGPRRNKDGSIDRRSTRGSRSTGPKTGAENLRATDLLLGIHTLLAELTHVPEFMLEESEAKVLGDASVELMGELGIPLTRKQLAIANFAGVAMKIYATRWTAYKLRRMMEAQMKPEHAGMIAKARELQRQQQPKAQPIQPPLRQPTPMPRPANTVPEEQPTNGEVRMAPSERWNEPAADFPGMG